MNDIISNCDKNHRLLQKCLCESGHYLHSEQAAFWQARTSDALLATRAEQQS